MYHRQVSSSPRSVRAIISSRLGGDGAAVEKIRLSMAGVTGSPVSRAEYRVWISADRAPSRIQAVGPRDRPLSNTDESRLDAWATTNGADSMPRANGSLRSVTGWLDSDSPTRVPPPGLLNTVRPSAASFAPADQYR